MEAKPFDVEVSPAGRIQRCCRLATCKAFRSEIGEEPFALHFVSMRAAAPPVRDAAAVRLRARILRIVNRSTIGAAANRDRLQLPVNVAHCSPSASLTRSPRQAAVIAIMFTCRKLWRDRSELLRRQHHGFLHALGDIPDLHDIDGIAPFERHVFPQRRQVEQFMQEASHVPLVTGASLRD